MSIELYTVEDYHYNNKNQLGILPGIPRSVISNPEIGQIIQGTEIQLIFPDGETRITKIADYYMRVPDAVKNLEELEAFGIILVLPEEYTEKEIPIGTKISLVT
ncbi:hypothetical protein F1728_06500 [Gimesia benthica]|uniref:Uncharacterized protein n=1 Tax=Gimesia benthica TaxID=2608982 RepID=A0A6I6A9T8_9PLAN|nr:hypothetical protein [Gimesia benthica]QGQ22342.1 hypothetical protein F1728_06500 [Gimesia benthica]